MICATNTGLIAGGALIKDAEVRTLPSGKQKLTFPLRYGWEEPAEPGGRRTGKLIDVDIWDDIDMMDGMLQKGDVVIVMADKVTRRESNGKIYRSISSTGLFVGAPVAMRWMQQLVDMIEEQRAEVGAMRQMLEQSGGEDPPQGGRTIGRAGVQEAQAANAGSLAGHELYEGEQLTDYAPPWGGKKVSTADEPPIEENGDLPF